MNFNRKLPSEVAPVFDPLKKSMERQKKIRIQYREDRRNLKILQAQNKLQYYRDAQQISIYMEQFSDDNYTIYQQLVLQCPTCVCQGYLDWENGWYFCVNGCFSFQSSRRFDLEVLCDQLRKQFRIHIEFCQGRPEVQEEKGCIQVVCQVCGFIASLINLF